MGPSADGGGRGGLLGTPANGGGGGGLLGLPPDAAATTSASERGDSARHALALVRLSRALVREAACVSSTRTCSQGHKLVSQLMNGSN